MVDYRDLFRRKGISLERLATLCDVVECGGIARAAGGDVSKTSLYSRQIKELEAALGVGLTTRVGRLAVPSPAARRLASIVRDQLKQIADLAAEAGAAPTAVTLGASNSLLEWVVLPRIPALKLALREGTTIRLLGYRSRDLVEALLDRQVDLGLVRSTAVGRGLKSRKLLDVGYALFVPEHLGRGGEAREILRTAPVATVAGGEFRDQLRTAAGRSRLELNIVLECPSFGMAARAVRQGSHAAILPEIAAASLGGAKVKKVALPFEVRPSRRIVLAHHPHVGEAVVEAVAGALGPSAPGTR